MVHTPENKLREPLVRALREVERLRKKLDEVEDERREPIAVVGIGLRLPGGVFDLSSLWRMLEDQTDAVGPIPDDRWDTDEYFDPNRDAIGKTYVRDAALLDAIDGFDPLFFNISPREARGIDPQHRLVLEASWEALEYAGIVPASLRESLTGVFVGIGPSDYGRLTRPALEDDAYSTLGTSSSFAAGRVAFTLGLQGPAVSIDTACSSSLVALHLACAALHARECSLALAAGVQVLASPEMFIQLARIKALAPDGRSKAFSANADGYGRGEGVVVLALERLTVAQAKGREILALIRGSAVNHDGPSSGITAPNGTSQQKVLRAALAAARLDPTEVEYVECHGTGTSLGDPIEVQALATVYGPNRTADQPLLLGAIKTNIGHLESASGLAGVAKVIAALRHGALPATIHTTPRNPHIDWDSLPVDVVDSLRPWAPAADRVRRAGVSSFGISGTNAHVILEEAPAPASEPDSVIRDPDSATCLIVSGQTSVALQLQARSLADHLRTTPEARLADVAFTLGTARTQFHERAAVVAASPVDAEAVLDALADGTPSTGYVTGSADVEGKVVFVFPGQGSQWPEMAVRLLDESPVFRARIEACAAALRPHTDWSLLEVLGRGSASMLERVDVVQPVLFAMMVSLAAVWRSLGVEPDAVVGHSQGEIAAAHVAGILSLEDAAKIVALRSRVVTELSGTGAMAALSLSVDELARRPAVSAGLLELAVDNGPTSTVVSGPPDAIDEFVAALEREGVFARKIKVDYASHCAQVEAIRDKLIDALAGLAPRSGTIPMYSTVDAAVVDGATLDGAYWYRNLRQTVRFADAVSSLLDANHGFFVEVSPHPVLPIALKSIFEASGRNCMTAPTLRRTEGSHERVLLALGELACRGYAIDWTRLLGDRSPSRVVLPPYRFSRQRYWLELDAGPGSPGAVALGGVGHPLVGRGLSLAAPEGARVWQAELSPERLPWLAARRLQTRPSLPTSVVVELMLAAATELGGPGVALGQLSLERSLSVEIRSPRIVQLQATPAATRGWSLALALEAEGRWTSLARGEVEALDPGDRPALADLAALEAAHPRTLDSETIYRELAAAGVDHSASFATLEQLRLDDDGRSALASIAAPSEPVSPDYATCPNQLEGALTAITALLLEAGGRVELPAAIERLERFTGATGGRLHCRVQAADERSSPLSLEAWTDAGELIWRATGITTKPLRSPAIPAGAAWARALFELEWREATLAPASTSGRWLVVADKGGVAPKIAELLRGRDASVTVSESVGERAVRDATIENQPLEGILDLRALDLGPEPSEVLAADVIAAVRAARLREQPRLVFVSRQARALGPGERVWVEQSLQWDALEAVRMAQPELLLIRADLCDPASADELEAVVNFATAGGDEDRAVIRGRRVHVARLVRGEVRAPAPQVLRATGDHPYGLATPDSDEPAEPSLVRLDHAPPGPREVEVEVVAAGVGADDLALGRGRRLGLEFAGRVTRVGDEVDALEPGERVIGFAPGALASAVTTPAELVFRAPPDLTDLELATLPVAHLTAYVALEHYARLEPGERVVIHDDGHGLGLAAWQWAKHRRAEVDLTAASAEHRAWLRANGVDRVLDPDDLDAEVDVVFSAASERHPGRDLALLRSGGRLIDLESDTSDEPLPTPTGLHQNRSFHSLNLRELIRRRPSKVRAWFLEVLERVAEGVLRPLPVVAGELTWSGAASLRADAGEPGKRALAVPPTPPVLSAVARPPGQPLVDPGGTYLITAELTAGLDSLGLALARALAGSRADLILLADGSTPDTAEHEALTPLTQTGVSVIVERIDAAAPEQLRAVLARIPAARPLRGVIHAAAPLEDRAEGSPNPATDALAWALHDQTRERELDFFMVRTSLRGVLGTAEATARATSNGSLHALVHERRSRGLPAIAVALGPIEGGPSAGPALPTMPASDYAEAMLMLAATDVAHAIVGAFDVRRWVESYPQAISWPLFSELLAEAPSRSGEGQEALLGSIEQATPEDAARLVVEHVLAQLGQVIRMDPRGFDPDSPFSMLGVDSLMGLELRNRLEASLGQPLSSTAVWTYATPRALANYLVEQIRAEELAELPPTSPAPDDQSSDIRERIENISDEDLFALGEELLS